SGAAAAGAADGSHGEAIAGTVSGQGERDVRALYGSATGASSGATGATGATGADVVRGGVEAGLWSGTPEAGTAGAAARTRAWTAVERRIPPNAGRAGRIGADDDEDEAAFAASELVSRLRAVVTPMGFRVEPLGRGVLHLHADMGRRGYGVLAQVLPSGERLDWAALLARRRASTMRYLAVFGRSE